MLRRGVTNLNALCLAKSRNQEKVKEIPEILSKLCSSPLQSVGRQRFAASDAEKGPMQMVSCLPVVKTLHSSFEF